MVTSIAIDESLEISPRFRRSIEERILRLEDQAARDEAYGTQITDQDHQRRHMLLVAVQRSEALRMRLFLDKTRTGAAVADGQS